MKSCPLRVAFAVVILWACVLSRGIVLAQVPGIINFQGKVAVSGTNMTGLGSFLFELVNGTGTSGYWSNDGRLPPASPVQLPVTNGMFSVMLGDTNVAGMTAIPFTVFTNSDVRLRVWFGAATNTIQQMSTDQRIAAVGYAMVAASLVGGYVDLASPQTITGAKLFATNLLVQQGGDTSVLWRVGVANYSDPDLGVMSNLLVFSANGTNQFLVAPGQGALAAYNLQVKGSVEAQGDISADGQMHAEGGLDVNADLTVAGNIVGHGSIEGNTLNVAGLTYGPGGLSVGNFQATDITASESVYAHQLYVSGTKNFVQPHPTDPTKEIVFTCLEGPEAGTYVRGSAKLDNGKAVIALPETFGLVTSTNGLTVQLTPRGAWLELYVTSASVAQVTVCEAQGRSGQFDYLVQGVRVGYENQPTIRDRKVARKAP